MAITFAVVDEVLWTQEDEDDGSRLVKAICHEGIDSVEFEDEVHDFLYENRNIIKEWAGKLIRLDRYGDEVFYLEDIQELVEISNKLLILFPNEKQLQSFLTELKNLCEFALEVKKYIVSAGD